MKPIKQIRDELAAAGKPVQTAQLYRYFRRFNISPAVRLRPAQYPDDTAARILQGLGLGKEVPWFSPSSISRAQDAARALAQVLKPKP